MKVLLVNGSPNKEGNTYKALCEVAKTLNEEGIDTAIFQIGRAPISGCLACGGCKTLGKCVIDDVVNDFLEIADKYDGFVFGSPVYYASANGAMIAFMDRVFYADGNARCYGRRYRWVYKCLPYAERRGREITCF